MKKTAKIFKALSNDTRLRIMALLSQNELCVCQIEKLLNINQTTASRHLIILKYSELVKDRREGLWIYNSIVKPKDEIGKSIGKLYSFNSFGSFAGSIISGFILIPALGIRATSMLVASINILVGILVLVNREKEREKNED